MERATLTSRAETKTETKAVNYDQVLKMVLNLGYDLLFNGAETHRVEDSCERVLQAYGCPTYDVYALANYLSISFADRIGNSYVGQKRLHSRGENLHKLAKLNSISRQIVSDKLGPEVAQAKIDAIAAEAPYSLLIRILGTGLIGFSFTLLIGGSLASACYAFCLDLLLRILLEPLYRLQVNRIFINILGGMGVNFLTLPAFMLGLGSQTNLIATGAFMFMFPGLALVNSIRDIMTSDYLAGLTKLVESLLVAISIAIGSGLSLSLFDYLNWI